MKNHKKMIKKLLNMIYKKFTNKRRLKLLLIFTKIFLELNLIIFIMKMQILMIKKKERIL